MNETPESVGFWEELKRRHVVRVATVYVVVSWLVLQVADVTFDNFEIPAWAFRFVAIVLALGFPVSLVLAWALEMTPQGIRRAPGVGATAAQGESTPRLEKRRKRFSALFAAAVPTVIFGTLALVFYLQRDTAEAPATPDGPAGPGTPSALNIAVLPLLNMSAVAENAYFAGGLHEDILTQLSRMEGFEVVSRTSVMPYFDSDKSLRVIGEELGADYVLEGSVRRIDDHVRVTVQLIQADNDRHAWAENYDREIQDEFATQSAIAREISRAIQQELVPGTATVQDDLPTRNVQAYDLYHQARTIFRTQVETEAGLARQRELLEAAVEADPDFVEAWAQLNDVLDASIRNVTQNGWFLSEGADPQEVLEGLRVDARRALDKAVSLDPDNHRTLLARAEDNEAELRTDFQAERRRILDRILAEDPDNAAAWYNLGWWNHIEGNLEAAQTAFLKAIELDPLNVHISWGSLNHFASVGDEDMANTLSNRLAQISPEASASTGLTDTDGGGRLGSLLSAFRANPDPQLLDRYGEILFDPGTTFRSPLTELQRTAMYWHLRNEPDRLLALQDRLELPDAPNFQEVALFNDVAIGLAVLHQRLDERESATFFARQVLATEPLPQSGHPASRAFNHSVFAGACAILGDLDCTRRWAQLLMDERDASYNAEGLPGYLALALVDRDRAVRLILEEKSRNPRWFGTDIIASFHLNMRELLSHPDLMAFYRDEGKWMDFLAERVPEYAAL